ncbi:hypothetical protein V6Z11_D11G146900 [Gossypium hirsutum]
MTESISKLHKIVTQPVLDYVRDATSNSLFAVFFITKKAQANFIAPTCTIFLFGYLYPSICFIFSSEVPKILPYINKNGISRIKVIQPPLSTMVHQSNQP